MSSGPRFPHEKSQRVWRPGWAKVLRQMFLLPKKLHRHWSSGKEGNSSTCWMKPPELCRDPSGYWLEVRCRRYLSPFVTLQWGYPSSQGCFHPERLWWPRWGDKWRIWWSVQGLQPQTSFLPVQARENLWEASRGLIFSRGLVPSTHVLPIHPPLAT